jgi:hypothetical protein
MVISMGQFFAVQQKYCTSWMISGRQAIKACPGMIAEYRLGLNLGIFTINGGNGHVPQSPSPLMGEGWGEGEKVE